MSVPPPSLSDRVGKVPHAMLSLAILPFLLVDLPVEQAGVFFGFFIWLIVIVLVGFSRMPVLVERIVYYHEEVPRLEISPAMASGYTIVVTSIVSLAAFLYLWLSGAFGRRRKEGVP